MENTKSLLRVFADESVARLITMLDLADARQLAEDGEEADYIVDYVADKLDDLTGEWSDTYCYIDYVADKYEKPYYIAVTMLAEAIVNDIVENL